MDILSWADSYAAKFVASFSPTAKTVIDFVRENRPMLEKAIPVVVAARKEGPRVIDAVRREAPETIEALRGLIEEVASKRAPIRAAIADEAAMEDTLRLVAGVPGMTAEEKALFDATTPGNDPSQENSQRGSG